MLPTGRAVLVRYTHSGQPRRGSGLHICGNVILTADHCADGTDHYIVVNGCEYPAIVEVRSGTRSVDLALLRGIGLPNVGALKMAFVDRQVSARLEACQALGFPRWKDRPNIPGGNPSRPILAQVEGFVPTAEGYDPAAEPDNTPLLTFKLRDPAVEQLNTPSGALDKSGTQWAGMSGAAVVTSNEQVVGVIRSHNLAEGGMSLSATPLESINDLAHETASRYWTALEVDDPSVLPWLPTASELARRLRQLMDARGWKAADIAEKAHIPLAAVRDALDPGSRALNPHSLDLIANALDISSDSRLELERLRNLADHSRQLDDYLLAAEKAAASHPYLGIRLGRPLPPLQAVYLRQLSLPRPQGRNDTDDDLDLTETNLMPAVDLLRRAQTCVVVAGPGGGKSSLLQTYLAEAVSRCRAGDQIAALPVLIPATDLAALLTDSRAAGRPRIPLPSAIAAAATDQLVMFGLREHLPASLFLEPPFPATPWIVMVDGLDEILDGRVRNQLLTTLAASRDGPRGALYRFIVTSRPLPANELEALGSQVPSYQLAGFALADVETFATDWFREIGRSAPRAAATQFIKMLQARRISDLASTPLMASMLCQLYSDAPGQPLPGSRGAIYQEFTDTLYGRQHDRRSGIRLQTRATLERYGDRSVAHGHQLLDKFPELIEFAAAERYAGSSQPLVEMLAAQPGARVPAGVPNTEWKRFIEAALRFSGLCTDHGNEYVFIHQTILEFLAARFAIRRADASMHVEGHGSLPQGVSLAEVVSRQLGFWAHTSDADESSYFGFILDALLLGGEGERETIADALRRLITNAGLAGCRFVAIQAQLGTQVPDSVIRLAARTLDDIARDVNPNDKRSAAIRTLATLGSLYSCELLDGVARDPSRATYQRIQAAEALAEPQRVRGLNLLYTLAGDIKLRDADRVRAAGRLSALGDPRGADQLRGLAENSLIHDRQRVQAAAYMTELGDPRGLGLLDSLARDLTIEAASRIRAAARLAQYGDSPGDGLLHDSYPDRHLQLLMKDARTKDSTGFELLDALARDGRIDGDSRLKAARHLVDLDDASATDLLADLASDNSLDGRFRVEAAGRLLPIGSSRAITLLVRLARNPKLDAEVRESAIWMLRVQKRSSWLVYR